MRLSSYQQFPPAVKNIIIICVLLFFGTKVMAGKDIDLYRVLGLYYFDSIMFRPWQLFTHLFMHGGFSHILFNMLALFMFGSALENILGTKRFLTLYFVSALGAVALDYGVKMWQIYDQFGVFSISTVAQYDILENWQAQKVLFSKLFIPMVGASGALYGIMVAFAVFFPNTTMIFLFLPFPIKAKYLIPIILLVDLFLGIGQFNWDPIAHFAHLGGAIFGFFLIKHWNKTRRDTFF